MRNKGLVLSANDDQLAQPVRAARQEITWQMGQKSPKEEKGSHLFSTCESLQSVSLTCLSPESRNGYSSGCWGSEGDMNKSLKNFSKWLHAMVRNGIFLPQNCLSYNKTL